MVTIGLWESAEKLAKLYKIYIEWEDARYVASKYKDDMNMYYRLKRMSSITYYWQNLLIIKTTENSFWKTVNKVIAKNSKTSIINHIVYIILKKWNSHDIANTFSDYFANIGKHLWDKILSNNINHNHTIHKIPRKLDILSFNQATSIEIKNIIRKVPKKPVVG